MPDPSTEPLTNATMSSTSPREWQYVSEGGATIVFSYRGPAHPTFSGTVLRLRKIAIDLSVPGNSSNDDGEEPDDPTIAFQKRVTSKLIPPIFLPRLEPIEVDRLWLEELRSLAENYRPLKRRQTDTIDVSRRKAVLATDLVGGKGWAVEIKPKWGFLPNLSHLSAETRDVKSRRCRFCIHSQYRFSHSEGSPHTYCPLDLFSGDDLRIAHALRNLWNDWVSSNGTTNNLRIFVQGKLIDPGDTNSQLPLSDSAHCQPLSEMGGGNSLAEAFVDATLPLVARTSLLRKLGYLQSTLDPLDIEGLFSMYSTLQANSTNVNIPPLEETFTEPTIDDWEHFANTYLDATFQESLDHNKPDSGHLHYYTMAYLMSATFKDCSVILRLGKGEGTPDTINVIDLDPKSMGRLQKWAKLDRDIALSFVEGGESSCVDGL